MLPDDADKALSGFVIHVSLPALILARVPSLQLDGGMLAPVLLPWCMVVVSALPVWAVARRLGWSREVTGALLLVVPLGNTSFLGIPMVQAFFGEDGVPVALLYDQLGSFLALSTWGAFVVANWGGGQAPTLGRVLGDIARFPPFVALIAAVALRWVPRPAVVMQVFEAVAASLVPVVMVAVGLQLRLRLPPGERWPFAFGLVVKLVLAPALALGVCVLLGWRGLAADVSVFEAAMPPMVIASVLATRAGLAPRLVGAMVGYGIVASFATLPLWYQLLARR